MLNIRDESCRISEELIRVYCWLVIKFLYFLKLYRVSQKKLLFSAVNKSKKYLIYIVNGILFIKKRPVHFIFYIWYVNIFIGSATVLCKRISDISKKVDFIGVEIWFWHKNITKFEEEILKNGSIFFNSVKSSWKIHSLKNKISNFIKICLLLTE